MKQSIFEKIITMFGYVSMWVSYTIQRIQYWLKNGK